ncbi:MAG: tol-pal system protein YbgF [Desulfobacteraceae bacterium]|nr:tol-pal system protein YbgF [Desulfobacteraceae bacterium]
MRKLSFLALCPLALFLVSGCVTTQDFSMLENRVAALEMDNARRISKEKQQRKEIAIAVNRVESGLQKSGKSYREGYAELKSLVEELKHENRQLLGRLEESEYRVEQLGKQAADQSGSDFARLDTAVSKNFQRLTVLEQYMGLEPSDGEAAPVKGGETAPADMGEKGLYARSKGFLDQEEYDRARKGFEQFLKRYPESENADNARFWIADSYYREKWYEKAILEYQKVVENYAKGNKVAAALLKQGYAFANLGEKANARLILKELVKKYPGTNEAKIAAKKLKTLK